MSRTYWTKADGKKVAIDKMSVAHIEACIKMLRNRIRRYKRKQKKYGSEADYATAHNIALSPWFTPWQHDIQLRNDWIARFKKELKKREV